MVENVSLKPNRAGSGPHSTSWTTWISNTTIPGKDGHGRQERKQVTVTTAEALRTGAAETAVYVHNSGSVGRYQQCGGKSSDGKGQRIVARNEEPEPEHIEPPITYSREGRRDRNPDAPTDPPLFLLSYSP